MSRISDRLDPLAATAALRRARAARHGLAQDTAPRTRDALRGGGLQRLGTALHHRRRGGSARTLRDVPASAGRTGQPRRGVPRLRAAGRNRGWWPPRHRDPARDAADPRHPRPHRRQRAGGHPLHALRETGCLARIPLSQENVEAFKAGGDAFLDIFALARSDLGEIGGVPVPLTASLRGFTAAYDAMQERHVAFAALIAERRPKRPKGE
jgi:hypothetical protein